MPSVAFGIDARTATTGAREFSRGAELVRRDARRTAEALRTMREAQQQALGGGAGSARQASEQARAVERQRREWQQQTVAVRDAAREQQRANQALLTARSTLGGAERAAAQYARFVERVDAALRAGLIDQARYNALLAEGQRRFSVAAVQGRDLSRNIGGLNQNFAQLSSTLSVLTFGPLSGVGSRLLSVQAAAQAGGASLAGMAVGIGSVAAAFGGLVALLRSSLSEFDDLGKTADAVGVSIEGLQRFDFVGTLSGVENVTGALEAYSRRIGEAAGGTGEAQAALETLNLELADLEGLRIEEQLQVIADRFRGITDPTLQAAVAADLFSRANIRMANVLRRGSEGLRELFDEADALGIIVSTETVRAAEELNDKLTIMQLTTRRAAQQIAIELFPVVDTLSEKFTTLAQAASLAIARAFDLPTTRRLAQDLGEVVTELERRTAAGEVSSRTQALAGREFALTARLQINTAETLGELDTIRGEIQAELDRLSQTEPIELLFGDSILPPGVTKQIDDLGVALEELDARETVLRLTGISGGFTGVADSTDKASDSLQKYLAAQASAADASLQAVSAIENENEKLRGQITALGQGEEALRAFNTEQRVQAAILAEIERIGPLPPGYVERIEAAVRANAELTDTYADLRDAARDAGGEIDRQLTENTRLLENTQENIQRGIGDTFTDVLRQAEFDFRSLEDVALDVIARIGGEFAQLALFDPQGAGAQFSALLGGLRSAPIGEFFRQREQLAAIERIAPQLEKGLGDPFGIFQGTLDSTLTQAREQTSILSAGFRSTVGILGAIAAAGGIGSALGADDSTTLGLTVGAGVGATVGSIVPGIGTAVGGIGGGLIGGLVGLFAGKGGQGIQDDVRDLLLDERTRELATLQLVFALAYGGGLSLLVSSQVFKDRSKNRFGFENVEGGGPLGVSAVATLSRRIGGALEQRILDQFTAFDQTVAGLLDADEIAQVADQLLLNEGKQRFDVRLNQNRLKRQVNRLLISRLEQVAIALEGPEILDSQFFQQINPRKAGKFPADQVAEQFFQARENFSIGLRTFAGEEIPGFETDIAELRKEFNRAREEARFFGFDVEALSDALEEGILVRGRRALQGLEVERLRLLGLDTQADLIEQSIAGERRLAEARAIAAELGIEGANAVALAQEINALEVQRILEQSLEPLRGFLTDVTATGASPLALGTVLSNAEDRFGDLLTQAQGGDLSVQEDLVDAARALLDVRQDAFGGSAGFFEGQFGFNAIVSSIDALVGQTESLFGAGASAFDTTGMENLQIETVSAIQAQTLDVVSRLDRHEQLLAELVAINRQQNSLTAAQGAVAQAA